MKKLQIFFEIVFAVLAVAVISISCTYAWPEPEYGLTAWVQAIGSIAAILVAILVMHWQNRANENRDEINSKRMLRGALRCLGVELFQYENMIKDRMTRKEMIWAPVQADFAIFNAYATLLGSLEDDTTLQYVTGSRLKIQNFFTNVNELSRTVEILRFEDGNPDLEKKVDELWAGLVEHSPITLNWIEGARQGIDKAIKAIDKSGGPEVS
ncbi:hypothetical protein [Massilia timonae]|uniref:Lipoprotein n=1 Tax=Massilia timonae TaxID=47229 RepID=A0A1S2N4P5_9BURK|nr:hypothetical protein [Massilia timonae]OIJ40055.1 hypothetical protein LO55_5038 [Massilia timonae]